jgi:hypothetical protein
MENANEKVHPGLEVLRGFIPNTVERRAFVREVIEARASRATLETMLRARVTDPRLHGDHVDLVHAFIEWI